MPCEIFYHLRSGPFIKCYKRVIKTPSYTFVIGFDLEDKCSLVRHTPPRPLSPTF